jgi:UDP-N-acetylmuramoyl-L-alanyl-D-glutamate--2,6-diaminopimelate ligase
MGLDGLSFDADTPWGRVHIHSAVLGRFNASNLLGTLAVLLASDTPLRDAQRVLDELQPVAGRAQSYGGGSRPLAVVDYAHTPDALEKMLLTLREVLGARRAAKLICVFGCGGDRDRGKRPIMGAIAARLADRVFVTSDNPRGEDPHAIIAEILRGVRRDARTRQVAVIEARSRAVHVALAGARRGDIVLVAGKGHEPYQEIAGVRHRYSDGATVRAALARYHA